MFELAKIVLISATIAWPSVLKSITALLTPDNSKRTIDARPLWVEIRDLPAGYALDLPASRFVRLYRNRDEGMSIRFRGVEIPVPADSWFFIPEAIAFSERTASAVKHLYVHVEVSAPVREALRGLAPTSINGLPPIEFPFDRDAPGPVMGREPDGVADLELRAVIFYVLASLLRRNRDSDVASAPNVRKPASIHKAIEYLKNHPAESIQIECLARKCAMSPRHFARLFQTSTGVTPAKFAMRVRLEAASKALIHTLDSIETVSARYGFADRYHFSHAFRRAFGQGPAEYRRRQNQGEVE